MTFNPGVVGSNPTGPSTLLPYLMQAGQSGHFLESRIINPGVLKSVAAAAGPSGTVHVPDEDGQCESDTSKTPPNSLLA